MSNSHPSQFNFPINLGAANNTPSGSKKMRPISQQDRDEIAQVFEMFDTNSDGRLDIYQFGIALRALGLENSKQTLKNYFQDPTCFREGHIDKPIFFKLVEKLIQLKDPEVELRAAFDLFDVDGQGQITLNSLQSVANELGENLSQEELTAMISEFDLDGKNAINFEEFKTIMSGTLH